MQSHLPFAGVAEGLISTHYIRNNLPDVAAAVAAGAAQPPDALQEWHCNWQGKTFRNAMRINVIESWHWRQTRRKFRSHGCHQ